MGSCQEERLSLNREFLVFKQVLVLDGNVQAFSLTVESEVIDFTYLMACWAKYTNLASRHYAHRRLDFKVRVIVMTRNSLTKAFLDQLSVV